MDLSTAGEVILDGLRLTNLSEKALSQIRRDQIGFIFQAYNLLPVLTARENIEYVMKLQGTESKKCTARSLEVAKKFGIETLLYKLPPSIKWRSAAACCCGPCSGLHSKTFIGG